VRSADDLASLLNWSGDRGEQLSWAEVEEGLSLRLPANFRDFSSVFPSGDFAERLYFVSPARNEESLRMFKTTMELAFERFSSGRDTLPDYFPHRFYPESGGLILWATGDDHCYFWDPQNSEIPDKWPIVFLENAGPRWGSYEGSIADFLWNLLVGNFEHEALYSDWSQAGRSFTPHDFH